MWGAGRAKPSLLTPPRRRQRRIAGAAKHEMHVRGQLVAKVEDAHPRREFQALGEPFCKPQRVWAHNVRDEPVRVIGRRARKL